MKLRLKNRLKMALIFGLGMIVGGILQNNRKYFYQAYQTLQASYQTLQASYQSYIDYLNAPDVIWTMVNVNSHEGQGDAHVIQVKGGKTILIDAGTRVKSELIPFLEKNKITQFDHVFISHAHRDHYDGLRDLIKTGIQLKEVYFNMPDKEVCDRERPWGCNYLDLRAHFNLFKKHNIPRKEGLPGLTFDLGNETRITILYAYDGANTPVGRTDINDTSLIMLLTHKDYKFLFTGDLNRRLGQYLADNATDIQADVLKVPHHGTEGLAPNDFFKAVNPKYAMVPSPKHLWCSDRSKRPRTWFADNNVATFVNGFAGNTQVQVKDNELQVLPEFDTVPNCAEAPSSP